MAFAGHAALLVLLAACGGHAEWQDGSESGVDGMDPEGSIYAPQDPVNGSVSIPGDRSAEGSVVQPSAARCEDMELSASLSWQQPLDTFYGMHGAGFMTVSPDGERLLTPPDEYLNSGYVEYAIADGAEILQERTSLIRRDGAWIVELRGDATRYDQVGMNVVDLETDELLLELDQQPAVNTLSENGEYVVSLYCGEQPQIERMAVSDGSRIAMSISEEACTSPSYYGMRTMEFVTDSQGDSVVFPTAPVGEIGIADFASRTVTSHSAYTPVEPAPDAWPQDSAVLTLAFSPSGTRLASVGGGGTLKVWSYPELDQVLPDISVSITKSFRDCYCTPRNFAPVAWSADERWFATTDEAYDIAVYRSCDGERIATIPRPAGLPEDRAGAGALTFSPDGSGLAILWLNGTYFEGAVEYYRLSE